MPSGHLSHDLDLGLLGYTEGSELGMHTSRYYLGQTTMDNLVTPLCQLSARYSGFCCMELKQVLTFHVGTSLT